ncbi:MAG: orotidine-5'-phosphate decarboxylase [Opitutae bacterium]|nr:orotidine-5'-phosphate decarboxylase [Opitutae bacterium]
MACDLILALDVPTREAAAPVLRQLRGQLRWVKIGLQMFTAYGPNYVREVAGMGFNVFLDLKLHDIPHTVAKAVESLAPLPISMLTLHTAGGGEMMRAALAAQQKHSPKLLLLGVTVLTSMDTAGLNEIGVASASADQVARLGRLAADSGLRGLVCSPLEVDFLRKTLPADLQLVTPGIRPAGEAGGDDQKRVMTPADAARAGSTYIVVGRPILQAADPAAAARTILAELGSESLKN